METYDFILRLCAALLAGLFIGFERQWSNKTSGLKTNMLVATGSAIFVLLSIQLTNTTGDVTRIVAQIVTGVGFLGAGVIFREGTSIHGLGSAATIWCSAAIGCLAASGFFLETFLCAFIVILLNIIMQPIDHWLKQRRKEN